MSAQQRLDAFIARVLESSAVSDAATATGRSDARQLLETYANEARVGLELIAPQLRPGMRLLEVGCGIGLLARFLHDEGHDVTGIEPGASGFGFMPMIGKAILSLAPSLPADRWRVCGAEALDPAVFGVFDLVYSTNVLEHIPDLAGAFRGMASVLAPDGRMLHLCPNYTVPYEPHFGIPLLPIAPELTRHLFPGVVRRLPGVWEELNFITSRKVRTQARANGLAVTFDRGIMAATLRRFDDDPVFRSRQGKLATFVHRVLRAVNALKVIERFPGEYTTPMVIRLEHQAGATKR